MSRIFKYMSVALFLIIMTGASVTNSFAYATGKSEVMIVVNFANGVIGDVRIRDDIKDIKRAIGNKRVKKSQELLEGLPSDLYILSFGTHKVFKHWNAFSYKDLVFKTKEGLGVGSKVDDFNRFFGQGTIREEGSLAICYSTADKQICVIIERINREDQSVELYLNSIVTEIWVW